MKEFFHENEIKFRNKHISEKLKIFLLHKGKCPKLLKVPKKLTRERERKETEPKRNVEENKRFFFSF